MDRLNLERLRSDRKRRLFACACAREVWHLLTDERSRKAVEVAEAFADGRATKAKLDAARDAADVAMDVAFDAAKAADYDTARAAVFDAARAAALAAWDDGDAPEVTAWVAATAAAFDAARQKLALLLDDLAGTDNHAEVPRTQDVVDLAQTIYDLRRWQDLPVLADALEEAGCTDAGILSHLRGPGPHALGCWALDAVLGKG
jgi:hypothetical protein